MKEGKKYLKCLNYTWSGPLYLISAYSKVFSCGNTMPSGPSSFLDIFAEENLQHIFWGGDQLVEKHLNSKYLFEMDTDIEILGNVDN